MQGINSILAVLLTCLLGQTALAVPPADRGIRFAPLPLLDERTLRGQFLPMLDYLSRRTQTAFQWVYLPRYEAVLQALAADRIDLAFLGPLPYLALSEDDRHFAPIVHFLESNGRHDYDCALVTFAPDGLGHVRDIRNKRIGLTQPYSTCGHFAVSLMLRRAGRDLEGEGNRYEYAGGHDKAILGVLRGTYDVAGAKRAIAERYTNLGITVIDRIGPFPGFVLVANNRTLSAQQRKRIRDALLTTDAATRSSWGEPLRNGAIAAEDKDFAALRNTLRGLPMPAPGGFR